MHLKVVDLNLKVVDLKVVDLNFDGEPFCCSVDYYGAPLFGQFGSCFFYISFLFELLAQNQLKT